VDDFEDRLDDRLRERDIEGGVLEFENLGFI
jgi:hypothetical protein